MQVRHCLSISIHESSQGTGHTGKDQSICLSHPAATLEQDETVKGLKNLDAGLVDGDQNGTSAAAHILDAPHHNGRCPSIQPRGWLVHEHHTAPDNENEFP